MDKALPSGGRDCGFESRLGLVCGGPGGLATFLPMRCCHSPLWRAERMMWPRMHYKTTRKTKKITIAGGDARIELATSCTRSRNHTTRPITQESLTTDTSTRSLATKGKGRPGVEPATYRAATNCSTTELTPQRRCYRCQQVP